ncbi:MAG: RDD family protein [Actinomycetes bacterium]
MDHYARLGVDRGAEKDEIRAAREARLAELAAEDAAERTTDEQRAANRTTRAQLNEAWNVLSDPAQRARYDEGLADGSVEVLDEVDPGTMPAPASDVRRVGGGPMSQRSRRPVIPLAPGLELADTKPRLLAMVFDLTIIVLIMFVTVNVGAGWYANRYQPAERAAIDRAQRARTDASKDLTDAEDRRAEAEDALARAKGADRDEARARLEQAERAERRATKVDRQAAERLIDAQSKLNTLVLVATLIGALLGLIYLVPSTAITGRTLGMFLRGVGVVRVDGSPATWGSAFARFVVPVMLASALAQIGLLVGLATVLWWFWDPNRQGLHDRLARTLVVSRPRVRRG